MLTITMTVEQVQGVKELIEMAERGREDFEEQARYGDYTCEDREAAAQRWHLAEAAAAALLSQVQQHRP